MHASMMCGKSGVRSVKSGHTPAVLSDVFLVIGQILLPVFVLIAIGWGLRRLAVVSDAGGRDLAQLLYWVLLPAQLLLLTSRVDIAQHLSPVGLLAIVSGLVLGMVGGWWASASLPAAARGCVMNGVARGNGAFIGLPVVELLARTLPPELGHALIGIYALLLGPSVIAFNIAAVVAFRLPHHGITVAGLVHAASELPRSPLIIACVLGAVLGWWHPGLFDAAHVMPGVAGELLGSLGSLLVLVAAAAVPLALIVAGQGLDFSHLRAFPRVIAGTVGAKLVLVPLLTWGICQVCGADPLTTAATTILMASPVAIASVPMARLMGGDAALMAGLVTATTVLAPLTLLGWLLLVGPHP
jgi:malonate transporter and related proteins